MSYSTYPIKLQLFQLILPVVICTLKGLADLYKMRKERKRTKVPVQKKRKTAKLLFLD